MLCFSFKENSISLCETRAKATENVSAKLSEECLQLFGQDISLDVSYTFLDYTLISDECNSTLLPSALHSGAQRCMTSPS